uniref:Uncharacterized protein n=1 Tax=Parastrongyloides trichosuri TaxID=131310 RepID=A0A0N4Z4E3_PARTI
MSSKVVGVNTPKRYEDVSCFCISNKLMKTFQAMLRSVNDLCIEIWNFYHDFDVLNNEGYKRLMSVVNNKFLRSTLTEKEHEGSIFVAKEKNTKSAHEIEEEILKDVEFVNEMMEIKFPRMIEKFEKVSKRIKNINIRNYMENILAGDKALLEFKIKELKETWPIFVENVKKEMDFKSSLLKDMSYIPDESGELNIALLSAWKHYIYVDYSSANKLYSLVVS